jgi:hypothetical protein
MPAGLGVEVFEVDGLFDYRLVRAENNGLAIGVLRRGGVHFVAVLDPDIATTESGVGVGAKVSDLVVALGAIEPAYGSERDERLVIFSALPNTRFVVDGKQVIAAVVQSTEDSDDESEALKSCDMGRMMTASDEVLATARFGSEPGISYGCTHDGQPLAIVREGERIAAVTGEKGHMHRVGPLRIPGLDFVSVMSVGDRWGIYAVTRKGGSTELSVAVTPVRLEEGRLVLDGVRRALRLTAASAGFVGVNLSSAEFLVELRGTARALEVGGIFLERRRGRLHNVVPVQPVSLPIGIRPGALRLPTKREKSNEAVDAGMRLDAAKP